MKKLLKRIFKFIVCDRWIVVRSKWPYPAGYATYNPYKKTYLDFVKNKSYAKQICEELNNDSV